MTVKILDKPHTEYLRSRARGHLATVAPNGAPQNKPVGFTFQEELGTLDISGSEMERSAKFRNIIGQPQVAFVVDDVPDPDAGARGVRFMEIRGVAEQVRLETSSPSGTGQWIIRIHPRRVVSWNVAGPGMHSAELATSDPSEIAARPALGLAGSAAEHVRRAVERQVDELQAGLHDTDAEIYNRHFALDVIWGSPYGATVEGYDALHAIHRRMHAASDRGDSRYEIVRVLALTADVALAQVRRTALDERGEAIPSLEAEPRFSEMALYVLARRRGEWWLAAGQNTIVAADRGAISQDDTR